jgi:hypothetical protein
VRRVAAPRRTTGRSIAAVAVEIMIIAGGIGTDRRVRRASEV